MTQSRFLPLILESRCWWSESNRKNHIKSERFTFPFDWYDENEWNPWM